MLVRSASATARESTACSSGTKMLTLPARGIDGAEKCDEQDDARRCSSRRRPRPSPPSGRTRPSAACAGPRRHRAGRSPASSSAEPSSASVATMPTSSGAETDRRQVDGQQHGDEAVAEIPQGARRVDVPDGARIAGRREAGLRRMGAGGFHGAEGPGTACRRLRRLGQGLDARCVLAPGSLSDPLPGTLSARFVRRNSPAATGPA